jgi:hypothetical protein
LLAVRSIDPFIGGDVEAGLRRHGCGARLRADQDRPQQAHLRGQGGAAQ